MFVPVQWVRPVAYPRVELLNGASLIRLGCKGLPLRNTLAYYEFFIIMDVKSFITLAPGADCWSKIMDNFKDPRPTKTVL